MDAEVQKPISKANSKRIVLISLTCFILILVALLGQVTYRVLKYDRIYKGVYISNLQVGNLSKAEAADLLKKNYTDKASHLYISLNYKNTTEKISFNDIRVNYNIQGAVEKAYSIGHTGNIFEMVYDILESGRNTAKVELPVSYDKEKLKNLLDKIYDKTLINVKEADLLIQDDKVTIRTGHHGESFDKSEALKKIEELVNTCKSDTVSLGVIKTQPTKINIDDYYNKISRDAADASYKIQDNHITIVPEVIGRSIDKSSLVNIAGDLENSENTERILPVIFTKPKITQQDVSAKLFKDTLYTFSTQFYTSTKNDSNRGENIRLAISKINGTMLAPGQVFSFNEVVGPRTEDGGYKTAHVYSEGKVIDGIGGGICQVSTTLYNTVLFSDLDVVERTNHMFTVGYVPLGRDAAVSYGGADFKFKNSTNWPVRLDGIVTGDNRIVFSLKGTSENSGKTVVINPQTVKTLGYATKYIDDPTLDKGKTTIKQNGAKGYIIDTYKVVKIDGKVTSEGKIHTSRYNPLDEIILRGTKKPGTVAPKPQVIKGVDDADNPPATERPAGN